MPPVSADQAMELTPGTIDTDLGLMLQNEGLIESQAGEVKPYDVGDRLTLITVGSATTIEVTVIRIISQTMSCTMLVDVNSLSSHLPHLPNQVILKLVDRRTSKGIRQNLKAKPWSKALEDRYVAAVREGELSKTLDAYSSQIHKLLPRIPRSWRNGGELELEAAAQAACTGLCQKENHAYVRLNKLQGFQVPKFFGMAKLRSSSALEGTLDDRVAPRGLLLEYIDGFEIGDIPKHVLPEDWQQACDAAVAAVAAVRERRVWHEDLCSSNIIMRKGDQQYEAFVLDFGLCSYPDERGLDHFDSQQFIFDTGETDIACGLFKKLEEVNEGYYEIRVSAKGRRTDENSPFAKLCRCHSQTTREQ